jgi:antitoxin HicB
MKVEEYPILVYPLTEEDGGGYMAECPDLPGCQADGETPAEALRELADAFKAWTGSMKARGIPLPKPNSDKGAAWRQRAPKTLHRRLAVAAEQEGVSLNSLVLSFIAEGLGRRSERTDEGK